MGAWAVRVGLVGLLSRKGARRQGARGFSRSSAQWLGHYLSATALCSGRAPAGFPPGAVARGLPPRGCVRLPVGFRPYLSATAQKIHDLITLAAVCEWGLSAPLPLPPSVFHGFIRALSRAYPPRIGRKSCVRGLRPRMLENHPPPKKKEALKAPFLICLYRIPWSPLGSKTRPAFPNHPSGHTAFRIRRYRRLHAGGTHCKGHPHKTCHS